LAAETDAALPDRTLALQYFIYETGGDNVVRLLVAGATVHRSYRYLHPPDVGRLLSAGRHWQDPHALAELRGVEGISDFNLLMNVTAAMEDVPAEGYGAWLEDLLLGEEFEALVSDSQRLVVLPFNAEPGALAAPVGAGSGASRRGELPVRGHQLPRSRCGRRVRGCALGVRADRGSDRSARHTRCYRGRRGAS
jgi:hypothetical protein